jgi:hypothetical protein
MRRTGVGQASGAVGRDWVLTTSQAGQNFYTGNNPENDRGTESLERPPGLRRRGVASRQSPASPFRGFAG